MKIIAGSLKGMKVLAPKGDAQTRPTSSKVREAILHKVTEDIQGSVFIDVFSGTGAVGLEALSRGASGCYFIENDSGTLKILKKNMDLALERLSKQGLKPSPYRLMPLLAQKALSSLKPLACEDQSYVLWADPPYNQVFNWLKGFKAKKYSFLSSLKLIILELDSEYLNHDDVSFDGWKRSFEKIYGSTGIVAWEKEE